jgi:LmbE family N-acetylglucosaminyl deacetylase
MSKTVAIIAAHPDDEVLGCGGAMARFAEEGHLVHVYLLADGETSRDASIHGHQIEKRIDCARRACALLGATSVTVDALPDNRLDGIQVLDLVKRIEAFVGKCGPQVVLTHHRGDVNVDHGCVHEAVIAACRALPQATVTDLLFFEVPSSTEWRPQASAAAFAPNWYIDISKTLPLKLDALRVYGDELRPFPHPRSIEAVEALAKWRGASAGVPAAEAFMLGRKVVRS